MVVPSKWLPSGDDSDSEAASKLNPPTGTAYRQPLKTKTETEPPVAKSKESGLANIIGIIGAMIGAIMVLTKISDWLSGGSSSSGGNTYQCINGHTMTSSFIPGKCIWCGSTMWPK
jgi:hypothetical protein